MSGDRFFLQLRHEAGPPVVNPGAAREAQCDADGNLLVAGSLSPGPPVPPPAPTTGPSPIDFDTVTGVINAAPCRLYQFTACNENAFGLWLLIIDQDTEPGDDEQAMWSVFVPGGTSFAQNFVSAPQLVQGLSFAWSLRPRYVYFPPTFSGSSLSVAYF